MTETMTLENGPMSVPSGGIASFRMSDEDLANLDREQDEQLAEEVYGSEGISRFTEIASDMAGLGRYGDDVVVHAQTGELVIPKSVLDDSPEIRAVVYQALREQGIEDPEQYVVGSGSASINPNTGLAEYGFFKGIKKAFKQVVKVVKKIAPIVLPIAMNMMFPGLGTIYGAALGSGIGTLIQGGSIKDALKSAAISGVTAAAYTGLTAPKGTSALDAIKAETTNPLQRFSNPRTYTNAAFNTSTATTPMGNVDPQYGGMSDAEFGTVSGAGQQPVTAQQQLAQDVSSGPTRTGLGTSATDPTNALSVPNVPGPNVPGPNVPVDNRSFFQKSKDLMFGQQPTGADLASKQADFSKSYAEGLRNSNPNMSAQDVTTISNNAARQQVTMESLKPGFLRTFGPVTGLTLGATYLGGGFDEKPQEDTPDVLDRDSQGNLITGATLIANDPDKYMIPGLNTATITYGAPKTAYQSYLDQYNPTYASASPTIGGPFQRVAQGGEIFPRRNGGIMPDEGVPGKDSVRAMLMPGEFVMTTDAVKGMGNGNLQQGIQNMYGVMANLERKGRMA
jgi:hypothetical protein